MVGQLALALLLAGLSSALRPEAAFGVFRVAVNDTAEESSAPRGSFEEGCRLFPGKRVVLVTVGAEYLEMFKNWLGSSLPFLQDTEHLLVVAEDQEAEAALDALRKDWRLDFSLAKHPQSSALLEDPGLKFGDKKYAGVVWRRPNYILRLLDQGCTVLYADIDTVWKKDVFLDVGAAGSGDLYLTDDSDIKDWNYCTCFMYIHPTHATKTLLTNWASHRNANFNQKEFNMQLRLLQALNATDASRPQLQALPFESYPPGRWADKVPSPSIFHANWMLGIAAKVAWLKHHNLWNPSALASRAA